MDKRSREDDNDVPLPLRLRQSLPHWHFASLMVRRIIRRGLSWAWLHKPPPLQYPPFATCPSDFWPLLVPILKKGVIKEVPLQPCFSSRIFTVPKPQGGSRLIIDLSTLNLYIPCPFFKMLDANKIRHTIPKKATFASLDITDAFHRIPIHTRFQKFIAFSIQGRLFYFQSMPFGLNLGPLIFTTVITPVLKLLHSQKISASVYIDDWLLWARDPISLQAQTLEAYKRLSSLGFLLNMAKSLFSPTSVITYLGVLLDGAHHVIRPADKYISKTSTFVSRFRRKRFCCRREYQRLLGLLNFAAALCKSGRLPLRLVIRDAPRFPKVRSSRRARSCSARISPSLRAHLLWWTKPGNLRQPVSLSPPTPTLTIWTDAPDSGWGSLIPQPRGLGRLACSGGELAHKRQGMPSGPPSDPADSAPQRLCSPGTFRQHSGCDLGQPSGLQHKQEAQLSCSPAEVPVLSPPVDDQGQLHSRPSEHLGRCPLQRSADSFGMGYIPGVLPPAPPPLVPPGGPVHSPRECSPPSVRVLVSPPSSSRTRRSDSGLEQVENNLPVPSHSAHPRMSPKASQIR